MISSQNSLHFRHANGFGQATEIELSLIAHLCFAIFYCLLANNFFFIIRCKIFWESFSLSKLCSSFHCLGLTSLVESLFSFSHGIPDRFFQPKERKRKKTKFIKLEILFGEKVIRRSLCITTHLLWQTSWGSNRDLSCRIVIRLLQCVCVLLSD